ncbi:PPOX class F420-dependent enzyme [Longimycelium tulufanense]|uniref:PPOX class F420-dependent enzyme n=2 Tax=Longimycelium tulufanense TaxID=907463 RepID=A0A8J3FVJ4_9PSEU|nr:PPOX class F420-dependent enzyme [Longimycelium tulufanense]
MTDAEWRAFLTADTRTAKLATVREDGRPHVAPVWFVLDGDTLVFTTGATSVKGRNLRRTGYAAVAVDTDGPPYAFVTVEGPVSISDDQDEKLRWATAVARRYVGDKLAPAFGARNAVPGEIVVRLSIAKVVGMDLSD